MLKLSRPSFFTANERKSVTIDSPCADLWTNLSGKILPAQCYRSLRAGASESPICRSRLGQGEFAGTPPRPQLLHQLVYRRGVVAAVVIARNYVEIPQPEPVLLTAGGVQPDQADPTPATEPSGRGNSVSPQHRGTVAGVIAGLQCPGTPAVHGRTDRDGFPSAPPVERRSNWRCCRWRLPDSRGRAYHCRRSPPPTGESSRA